MLISEFLHNLTTQALEGLLKGEEIDIHKTPDFIIEKPKNPNFGDFATSLPLQISKLLSKNPLDIAKNLVELFPDCEEIEKLSVEKPGFINFSLSKNWIKGEIKAIISNEKDYGRPSGPKDTKVQVEFVSVNPTGRLHLGHIRGAVIGSTIANLLENQRFHVEREYYVNDAGNQMEIFGRSVVERIKEINGMDFNISEDHYKGDDIVEIARELAAKYKNDDLKNTKDTVFDEIKNNSKDVCIKNIKEDLGLIKIEHDNWFYESSLIDSNYFSNTLDNLSNLNLTYEKDGAIWVKTEELGDERDNVLIKSNDNKPTYFATDIAYHRDKFEVRNFDKVIDLWGADHHGHIKRMELILEELGIDSRKLKVLLNQIVSLKSSSGVSKFSKREGTSIFLKDLVEEIGSDACRFSFINRSPESHMEIDIDIFKKQSSENPVFYIQYAHARVSSILRSSEHFDIDYSDANTNLLVSADEVNLLKKLIEYPELLNRVTETLNVHELASYALELAQAIHKFYEKNRVIDEDLTNIEQTKSRLLLIKASKIILSNLLDIMGMDSPEKM
ncbi:MAG: arginine--tRNA ligase [Dehalococcoidia bacterium]|nr:arginine--tRNA ligase [Dehalococcoidia bacterium]|tara:strand:+ start:28211 stop:29884 length:1674 start_codon:yes stop_codon:yes gene_type:complete